MDRLLSDKEENDTDFNLKNSIATQINFMRYSGKPFDATVEAIFSNARKHFRGPEKTKIVCFCGSTKFEYEFMTYRWTFEKLGMITLGINHLPEGYFKKNDNHHGAELEGVKKELDELHLRKIDLCDEVYVLNVGGYIGESTRNEIEYAKKIGKPITYLHPEP